MKRIIILLPLALFLALIIITFYDRTASSEPENIILEDFEKYNGNPFSDWKFKKEYYKAADVYTVAEENGKKFLRATCNNKSSIVLLGKRINNRKSQPDSYIKWDIFKYPYVSWEWRVSKIPTDANEDDDDRNDSAASLYIVFQKTKIPLTDWQNQPANWIKYVWSSTLPVGTVVTKKFPRIGISLYEGKYIVVASGEKDSGRWITFKRNILEDYRKCFGGNPSFHPSVIGILTDANTTHTQAEADYDNIIASQN